MTLDDVILAGYSLKSILKMKDLNGHITHSIWFYWDNPPAEILDAGEPAWYKMDPASIPAGGVGQVIVRLRRVPTTPTLAVNVDTSANALNTTFTVDANAPQLANISFSDDLRRVYLYWRRTGGAAPTTILMDGTDVTADCVTRGDDNCDFAVSVLTRPAPLTDMSYHVFQGVYADAETATGGRRAWVNPFVYGSWAAFPIPDGDYDMARAWLDTCYDRGINTLEMNSGSSGLMDFLGTSAGKAYADARNYGLIKNDATWGTWSNNPRMWFIDDEPDAEEANLLNNFCGTGYKFPCGSNQAGTMGMYFISVAESLRAIKDRPTTINMDGTWKPYSWYAYGQLSDFLAIDHYYQPKVRDAYYNYPNTLPLYRKATVIYATALAGTRAAEPNPYRQLLYSCQLNDGAPVDPWPWAAPETKRTEAYYAMAAGAKGICYWWFKKAPNASNGLGDNNLQAQDPALWKEIGLLGAEIKALRAYLVTSHPVDLDLQGSTNVWVKALARGTDTLILFVVNDDHWNDQDYHCTPVANASVTVGLPLWMRSSPTAFEFSRAGLGDVGSSRNGDNLTLTLGTLTVAKIVIVTVDPQLRMTIQQRYDQEVWPGICRFAPDVGSANTNPPTILVHPSNKSVLAGGSATFAVTAGGGSPLSFQWQKNGTNLTNGGHYSGCNTFAMTVSSADGSDEAAYRCVITNPYGSATTNAATLALCTITITQQPNAQYACPNGSAQFTVAATGQGSLTYQWQKNGADLNDGGHYSGATTGTLTVSNADSNDEAYYRCIVVDNTSILYSDEATLTIGEAVTITQHPSSQLVKAGGTVQFTVVATGSGTLRYQWQKDQANLSDGGHYSGCTTATLMVSNANSGDEGGYRCVVTDDCGSIVSREAALTLDACGIAVFFGNGDFENWPSGGIAPSWTGAYSATVANQFVRSTSIVRSGSLAQGVRARDEVGAWAHVCQGFETNVGDALTIVAYAYPTAAASGVNPQVGVNTSSARPSSWLYTLSSFTRNTWCAIGPLACNASGTTTYLFLDVKRVGAVDTTTYWDDVSVYHAHVPPAPAVTHPTSTSLNVNVNPGCNLANSLAEYAIGIGGGVYTLGTHWVQGNGTIGTAPFWQTDAAWGTKTVSGLTTGTAYTFKVKARYNSTYTRETSLGPGADGTPDVETPPPPVITGQPQSQDVCPGSIASFSVTATGTGELSYQWQRNGINIAEGGHYSGSTTATLTVTGTDIDDEGQYLCVVANAGGSTSSNSAALTLKAAAPVDLDGDCDVDASDLVIFMSCLSGPDVNHDGRPACQRADSDDDLDVDQRDFGIFQKCLSGVSSPSSPQCAN
ncbi:MAG: immunoglobulin domain-containing protein [Phycisphaerae bacterium]